MTAITSEQVMNLRNQTGAGIMDCKSALKESAGDTDKAVELLRKKGLAGLAKRAGRVMKEGLVALKASADGKAHAMVEINCETDFVAKNPEVRALAQEILLSMLAGGASDPAEDAAAKGKLQAVAMKMGENMQIRRGVVYHSGPNSAVNFYLHSDARKAALVELQFQGDLSGAGPELQIIARELAMQSVAMSPKWLKKEDVSAEIVSKEQEIYKASPQAQGKTGIGLEKMLQGRVQKFYQESCLLEQASIRDSKLTVLQTVKNAAARLGGEITVKRFDCYIVGVE